MNMLIPTELSDEPFKGFEMCVLGRVSSWD